MTLTSSTVRLSYNGDGSTTSFSVTFVFWEKDDLRVILRDANGAESVWTRGTEYTVTGGDGSTGTVEVETSPTDFTPASGETLVILSNVPNTQLTSFPLGGPFPSTSAEQELDKTNRRVQQQEEELGRALKFSETSPDSGVAFPDVTGNASKVARVKSDESGLEMVDLVDVGDLSLHVFDQPTRAAVALVDVPSGPDVVRTAGYATVGDGGGALYKRVGAEPSHELKVQSSDGAWWELVPDPMGISVRQAGAKGDDSTDDSQAFIDAIAGVEDFDNGGTDKATHRVIVPPGRYYLAGNTLELKRVVHLLGSGSGMDNRPKPAKLRWDANTTGIIVHNTSTTGATTEGTGTGSAGGSIIEGLELDSEGGTIAGVTDGTKGHGIWLRARADLKNLYIHDFPGHGVQILATQGGGGATEGNANGWAMTNVRSTSNHLSGVYVDGADVNAGAGILIDASSNGRWGINDSSFLGNTWIMCHSASNGIAGNGENGAGETSWVDFGGNEYAAHWDATEAELVATEPGTDGTVWRLIGSGSADVTWTSSQPEGTFFPGGDYLSDNANARNVWLNCYREGDSAPPQFEKPVLVFGGKGMQGSLGTNVGMIIGETSGPNDLYGSWEVKDELVVGGTFNHDGDNIGFFGQTPDTQYSNTGTTTGFTAGSGTGVNDDSTFTGNQGSTAYTVGDVVRAMKLYGLMAE